MANAAPSGVGGKFSRFHGGNLLHFYALEGDHADLDV
jgi:hypothetical protein